MNSMEADEMAALVAVLETGSFAAAGRQLGRDSSVISRRLKALETRLGTRLVERSTRRLSPTDAGQRLRERVQEAMQLIHNGEEEARSLSASPIGLLRLTLPTGFGRRWIAPRLPEFLARYPSLDLETVFTDRFVDLIAERFDAGVRIGRLEDSRLVARQVLTMRRLLCASPAYLKAHPPIRHPRDLAQHACIGFSPMASHPVWHLSRDGKQHAVRTRSRLATDDIDALMHAALQGTGVAYCADWIVANELREKRLVEVLPAWQVVGDETMHVIRASAQYTPAKVRAFVDWMTEEFQHLAWPSKAP
ncbi:MULTISPECIES: LysR family transcriptional regulator [unclassified Achromobacter]|uniref:LysR family transcriptional regulator n=1 Tax=unclassified Achromobacter TaxID=2626865 RepID=UPI000B51C417|nr:MULTISPECIES: LysR family transcriptional regulator [unclassified Achromobacter]OWT72884.1 transcriptional regulator [Achromobacter sp. HZ34]OWT74102.1 transcriptional regulator [Achromobacter sp. HZ28]